MSIADSIEVINQTTHNPCTSPCTCGNRCTRRRAEEADLEEVIIAGTRLADRSAADSPVPADVISGSDMRVNGSTDIQDMLRTQVSSFDINT